MITRSRRVDKPNYTYDFSAAWPDTMALSSCREF